MIGRCGACSAFRGEHRDTIGIGVDRLVMLLTGRSIRETVAFPLVKGARDS